MQAAPGWPSPVTGTQRVSSQVPLPSLMTGAHFCPSGQSWAKVSQRTGGQPSVAPWHVSVSLSQPTNEQPVIELEASVVQPAVTQGPMVVVLVGATPVVAGVPVSPTEVAGPALEPEVVSIVSRSGAFGPQPEAITLNSSADVSRRCVSDSE
jgi:hypothetical protein